MPGMYGLKDIEDLQRLNGSISYIKTYITYCIKSYIKSYIKKRGVIMSTSKKKRASDIDGCQFAEWLEDKLIRLRVSQLEFEKQNGIPYRTLTEHIANRLPPEDAFFEQLVKALGMSKRQARKEIRETKCYKYF